MTSSLGVCKPDRPRPRGVVMFDRDAGQFVCDFVERLPTTDTGKPFRLYQWQRDAIMEFYSTMVPESGTGSVSFSWLISARNALFSAVAPESSRLRRSHASLTR